MRCPNRYENATGKGLRSGKDNELSLADIIDEIWTLWIDSKITSDYAGLIHK